MSREATHILRNHEPLKAPSTLTLTLTFTLTLTLILTPTLTLIGGRSINLETELFNSQSSRACSALKQHQTHSLLFNLGSMNSLALTLTLTLTLTLI